MELELWQITLIGIVASILAQGLRLLAAKFGWSLNRTIVSLVVLVVSIILAWLFEPPVIPPETDAMKLALNLLEQASAVMGVAVLIYNILLEKLFASLGLTPQKVLAAS